MRRVKRELKEEVVLERLKKKVEETSRKMNDFMQLSPSELRALFIFQLIEGARSNNKKLKIQGEE